MNKTNDEIDEMIKDYIGDDYTMPDDGVVYSNDCMMSSNPSDYTDLISIDADTIDLSTLGVTPSTITITDPYEQDPEETHIERRLSAIEKRLKILEPRHELLDKYEVLQSLYEQYKAAEAMLYEPDAEDEQ